MDDNQAPQRPKGKQPPSRPVMTLRAAGLVVGSPETGLPSIGQRHHLKAESVATHGLMIREGKQIQHHLRVGTHPTRKKPERSRYRQAEIEPVLSQRWPGGIPSELSDTDYLKQARAALRADPRTRDLPIVGMRKTLLRYRETHQKVAN